MADKKLEVYLDLSNNSNPKVIVDRDVTGRNKTKIVWEPGTGEDFDFAGLAYWTDGCLSNQDIATNKKKITADNNANNKGPHEYVLSVSKDGKTYNTTVSGPPTGDKPVIRN